MKEGKLDWIVQRDLELHRHRGFRKGWLTEYISGERWE